MNGRQSAVNWFTNAVPVMFDPRTRTPTTFFGALRGSPVGTILAKTRDCRFATKNRRSEMKRITFIAVISAIALGAATPDHVTSVENGLLPAVVIKGRPVPHYRISDRMKALSVRGASVAVIDNYEIE